MSCFLQTLQMWVSCSLSLKWPNYGTDFFFWTCQAIYALISPDIKPNPNEVGTYGIACDRISSLPANIDITFTSQSGTPFNLTIPSSELSVGPFASDPTLCQTLINAFDGLELVGGSLLKHYYSIWDVGNKRLGFAPAVGVWSVHHLYTESCISTCFLSTSTPQSPSRRVFQGGLLARVFRRRIFFVTDNVMAGFFC